jgi:hypothetical protein
MEVFAFANELVLTMDKDCEKLARYQIIANTVFWKITLKKDIDLNMNICEVGMPENKLSGLIINLKINDSPEVIGITCYKDADNQWLKYTLFNKNGSRIKDGAEIPIDCDAPLIVSSDLKNINLNDKNEVNLNLQRIFPNVFAKSSIEGKQVTQIQTVVTSIDSVELDTTPKKYNVILRINRKEGPPNTEIRYK